MHPFMANVARLARAAAVLAVACAALRPLAIGHAAQGRDVDGFLMVGGMRRTYLLHLPAGYSAAHRWPLLLAYHGRGGSGQGMPGLTHLSGVADRYGFIVAYPDGYRRSWADGRGATPADRAGIDDVAFSLALLDTLESHYAVDRGAVGATGISNGGFMIQRLACLHAERFAAIAPVASALPPALAASCALTRPIAVLAIQGTEDPLVPYAGGRISLDRGDVLSSDDSIRRWAALDGCTGTPRAKVQPDRAGDGTSVTTTTYTHCSGGATVERVAIVGGGHTWPGGLQYLPARLIGRTTHNLDAGTAICQFLRAHSQRGGRGASS